MNTTFLIYYDKNPNTAIEVILSAVWKDGAACMLYNATGISKTLQDIGISHELGVPNAIRRMQ